MSDGRADVVARLRAAGCVFAEDEARLLTDAAPTPADLDVLVDRRAAGEPLEYLLGWVAFGGLRIAVEAGVFVPRRRTEFLAEQAAAAARSGDVVVDLCCGCGAVAALIAATVVPGVEIYAVDVDPVAVRCARRNLGGRALHGDLYDALPAGLRGRVAVLTANAPYVPTSALATMPAEARLHEPRVALDGGPDGLSLLRRIIAGASCWLAPGGRLFVESSSGQATTLLGEMTRAGLTGRVHSDEERGGTVVAGRLPVTRATHRRA